MRATRRFWGVAATGAFLALLAVLLARPLLLAGSVAIGAWLLARQYAFYRALRRARDSLDVEGSLSRTRLSTDESTSLVVSADLADPSTLRLAIEARPPAAAVGASPEDYRLELSPGQREARVAGTLSFPIAGTFAFDPPRLEATDPLGLFVETLPVGSTPTVTVEPRAPRNVHVGEGGDRIVTAYGEHSAGRLGSGLDPAEIREYVPGDSADRIDWRATARLAEPHVREYEAETDRRTVLLVDHRAAMDVGPDGETKLDYLRQVALAFAASARSLSDPLGCYAVGDAGLTAEVAPAADEATYARVRDLLFSLRPTDGASSSTSTSTSSSSSSSTSTSTSSSSSTSTSPSRPVSGSSPRRSAGGPAPPRSTVDRGFSVAHATSEPRGPAEARRAADRLGEGAFGRTLGPFFEAADPYVRRIEGDPLFETVRTAISRLDGTLWTVVFTDDGHPERLREAVKVARRGEGRVVVFLAPTALFEPGGLADLEAAYDRYLAFEEFRRDLSRLPGVSAFEVAPGDRVETVLAARRERRGSSTVREGRSP